MNSSDKTILAINFLEESVFTTRQSNVKLVHIKILRPRKNVIAYR